jgi:hypothetical protein
MSYSKLHTINHNSSDGKGVMLSIDQPSITGANRTVISDAKSCQHWIAALPLTNAPAAQTEIQLQLELLNHTSALSGLERWLIMEQLRESLLFVQDELAKKFLGKPMPLEDGELALWKKTLELWQYFTHGYQICLQNYQDNEQALASFAPALLHRILQLTGKQIATYQQLYHGVPDALWKQLHKTYASAEKLKLEKATLKDPLSPLPDSTRPESAYVQVLLMDLADPYHLQPKQFEQINRWLSRWSTRVNLSANPSAVTHPELKLPTLIVDLNRPTGIQFGTPFENGASVRHLDMNLLAATLIKRIRHLRKGGAPEELDIGAECQQPSCEAQLVHLYQQWCEPPQNRTFERRPSDVNAQISFGIAAIHFFCNGAKPFRQPSERPHEEFSWREAQDLKMFGQVSSQTKKLQASQAGYSAENWQILDESAMGFKLAANGLHAARVTLNQLIAIRHPQAKHFAIGMIRWMRFDANGDLNVGIRTYPGIPMAVGIRSPVLISTLQNKFLQAFLLPEIPALKTQASLVLPLGWFAPNKQIELLIDDALNIRLIKSLERGADFERVGFEIKQS